VKRHQILDGVFIANELVDAMMKEKKETLLFKVGFEKSYDSMSWDFLDYIMERMRLTIHK